MTQPLISIIMGSRSDWETMEHAAKVLDELRIPYEVKIVSAHRTPDLLFQFAESASKRGLEVIIAGALEMTKFARKIRLNKDLAPIGTTILVSLLSNMALGFIAGLVVSHLTRFIVRKSGRCTCHQSATNPP